MNISYDFKLRAAQHGHVWTGSLTPSTEEDSKEWIVACSCTWKAKVRDPYLPGVSDPLITWANHVIESVGSTHSRWTPGRIRLKGGQDV